MHEIDMEIEEARIQQQLAEEINYWGEVDYGRCQSIEIPMSILGNLLNQPPLDVKEQLKRWYEYGQKTDAEREKDNQKG